MGMAFLENRSTGIDDSSLARRRPTVGEERLNDRPSPPALWRIAAVNRQTQTPARVRRAAGSQPSTAYRRLVGTGIAAVSEEGGGILSGDAVERRSECLFKSLDGARSDPPQIGLHLCPARFDRAKVRAVGRQVAIRKA